jgi:copper chaperone
LAGFPEAVRFSNHLKKRSDDMTTIKIRGMSCGHCVMAVKKALMKVEGLKDVQVNLEKGEATFAEEKPVEARLIREAVEEAGYDLA